MSSSYLTGISAAGILNARLFGRVLFYPSLCHFPQVREFERMSAYSQSANRINALYRALHLGDPEMYTFRLGGNVASFRYYSMGMPTDL